MDCERANELIPLYLDQALEDAETKELRAHLLQCKVCKQELIELEEVVSKLQTMPKQALPQGYHEELMGKIRASAGAQTKKKIMAPWMGAGVAAVIAVAVYAGGGFDAMLQNRDTANDKKQGEIASAEPNNAMLSVANAEGATEGEIASAPSDEIFENMDEVDVLDTAEADAAAGSLPGAMQGSVVSSVVPSNEEFIIVDDLAGGDLAGGNLAPEIITADAEPIILEAPPQEPIQPIVTSEPTETVLLSEIAKTRSTTEENNLAEPVVAPSESEVAWEIIPEEDSAALDGVTVDGVTVEKMEQPLAATSEMSKSKAVQPQVAIQAKESAIGLKNSSLVSMSISGSNMQEIFQRVNDYILAQGGMVLHEAFPEGLADANAPVIPENRILFKIPKAVYETTIAELSKFSIISDYTEWEAPMDTAYEVLKQERIILEKNGYQDLEAQLAEYDRRIATWENEEEYATVYLTVLENEPAKE